MRAEGLARSTFSARFFASDSAARCRPAQKTSQDVSVGLWRVLRDDPPWSQQVSVHGDWPRLRSALPLRFQRRVPDAVSIGIVGADMRDSSDTLTYNTPVQRSKWPRTPDGVRVGRIRFGCSERGADMPERPFNPNIFPPDTSDLVLVQGRSTGPLVRACARMPTGVGGHCTPEWGDCPF